MKLYRIYRDVRRGNRVLDVLVSHRGGMEFRMDGALGRYDRVVEVSKSTADQIIAAVGDCYCKAVSSGATAA